MFKNVAVNQYRSSKLANFVIDALHSYFILFKQILTLQHALFLHHSSVKCDTLNLNIQTNFIWEEWLEE